MEDQLDDEPKKWMSTKQEKGNSYQISHMSETEKSVETWNINKMPQRVMQNTLFLHIYADNSK